MAAQSAKEEAPRIAVMTFDGAGVAEREEVGAALQAMLITDLSGLPGLRLVERARLQDVVAEQQLGANGYLDPATVARMGKLLGASHLLVGSCTVVGAKMRLDARLVTASGGAVVLAEQMEGEKDAFFELEKELAQKLVVALGIHLAPKSRAEMSKLHTSDYDAFRAFGRGLRLRDAKKLDLAIAALREATLKDKDFKLAALTLDEYQRIIVELRTRGDELLLAQRNLERAKHDETASAEATLLENLQAKADKGTPEEKLTALHGLSMALTNAGSRQNRLHHLRHLEDRFSLERQGEAAAARYIAAAQAAFPKAPLTIDEANDPYSLTENLKEFDKEFAWAMKKLLGDPKEPEENQQEKVRSSVRYVEATARMLHFDDRQTVAFHQQLFERSKQLPANDYHLKEQTEELAKQWRAVLELDRSTALLTELSRGSDNPWRLKGLAQDIERNRDLAQVLATSAHPSLAREYLLLHHGEGEYAVKKYFSSGPVTPEGFAALTQSRAWPHNGYLLIGEVPAWSLGNPNLLFTGPRTDARRASEIRYFRSANHSEKDADPFLVMGAAPRGDFKAAMRVAFNRPEDFRPRKDEAEEGSRPEVSFVFAITDVDCDLQEEPGSDKRVLTRPMEAFAVVLGPHQVRFVQLLEDRRDTWNRKQSFAEKVLDSKALEPGTTVDVAVQVAGQQVMVTIGGQRLNFKLPSKAQGFTGLRFKNAGFASMANLTFSK